jgi:hypothetical protein
MARKLAQDPTQLRLKSVPGGFFRPLHKLSRADHSPTDCRAEVRNAHSAAPKLGTCIETTLPLARAKRPTGSQKICLRRQNSLPLAKAEQIVSPPPFFTELRDNAISHCNKRTNKLRDKSRSSE